MINVYERVVGGQVVERVQPTPGDFEDTRLGVAVIDGLSGWRLADAEPPHPPSAPDNAADTARPTPELDEPDVQPSKEN